MGDFSLLIFYRVDGDTVVVERSILAPIPKLAAPTITVLNGLPHLREYRYRCFSGIDKVHAFSQCLSGSVARHINVVFSHIHLKILVISYTRPFGKDFGSK